MPVGMREMVDHILKAGGQSPVRKVVSPRLAYAAGAYLEGVYRLLRVKSEPPLTRHAPMAMSRDCVLKGDKAKRDLGYEPLVSVEEGMQSLAAAAP